ncbi:VOC family protein [Bifidobacterium sp. UBA744]|uniref:VOC family protein n=1 Tax=Bifidobacterium sp. UBA744 TaxID=1946112 RepID=UPI0025BA56AC|nr:VOC family protein [Bifidobacterium sp. UBA744]
MAIQDDITGVQHVGIPSKDLNVTLDYYKKLGFKQFGPFPFDEGRKQCAFLRFGNLTIETWTGDPAPMQNGAINHVALNTPDIEKTFEDAKAMGLELVEGSIQSIPTFWDNGIKYFNVLGPNHETIEFCQIL